MRALADKLGVAENTAHRALAALSRAGVVEPEHRRAAGGAFEPSRYRLHLSPDAIDVTPTTKTCRASKASTFADDQTVEPAQLSLLDTA